MASAIVVDAKTAIPGAAIPWRRYSYTRTFGGVISAQIGEA